MPDCLQSLRARMVELNISTQPLGDFDTLSERLHAEVAAAKGQTPLPPVVSARSRKSGRPAFS
jgi:hypothetical protein